MKLSINSANLNLSSGQTSTITFNPSLSTSDFTVEDIILSQSPNYTIPTDVYVPSYSSSGSNIINVKSSPYNAVGNGVTDDTSAINSAIVAANAARGSYGTSHAGIYIPSGTYIIDSYFYLTYSNIIIFGDGPSTILRNPNNPTYNSIIKLITASNVIISDMFIEGNKQNRNASDTADIFGILTYRSNNIVIKNVTVSNVWGIGVGISEGYKNYFSNVTSQFSGNKQPGFWQAYVDKSIKAENYYVYCNSLYNDLDGVIISNSNVFIYGGKYNNNGQVTYPSLVSGALGAAGIFTVPDNEAGTTGLISNITIKGVTANENTEDGLVLEGKNIYVSNCYTSNNWLCGIRLLGDSSNVTILNNDIFNNGANTTISLNPNVWLKSGIGFQGVSNLLIKDNWIGDTRQSSSNKTQKYGIELGTIRNYNWGYNYSVKVESNYYDGNKIDDDNIDPVKYDGNDELGNPTLELSSYSKSLYFPPKDDGFSVSSYTQQTSYSIPSGFYIPSVIAANSINVKASPYFALGNGSSIDDSNIQNALNAAGTLASSIGRANVYIPTGTYILSGYLDVPSNVTIFGDGLTTIIKKRDSTARTTNLIFRNVLNSNVIISDLSIDGNKAYANTTSDVNQNYGIVNYLSNNNIFSNLLISNSFGIGLGISEGYKHLIKNVTVTGTGITPGDISEGFWSGSYPSGKVSEIYYLNCESYYNDGDGLITAVSNVFIYGGKFHNNGLVKYPTWTSGALGAAGIYTYYDSNISNLFITDAIVFNNSEAGIDLRANNIYIANCQTFNNGLTGIRLEGFSNNITISNCIIYNNGANTTIALNPQYWSKSGISFDGSSNIIIKNNIIGDTRPENQKTQKYGIEFLNAGKDSFNTNFPVSRFVTVSNNYIEGNKVATSNIDPSVYTYANLQNLTYILDSVPRASIYTSNIKIGAQEKIVSGIGALSNFSGSGTSYTAIYTPPTNSIGQIQLFVEANKVTNTFGNQNYPSDVLTIYYNTTNNQNGGNIPFNGILRVYGVFQTSKIRF